MECGLQWKDITCWEDASRLTLTHEETLETAIADYCPDMGRVVETAGQLCLRSIVPQGDGVELRGTIQVTVLYTSEESVGLRSLTQSVPFTCWGESRPLAACQVLWAEGRLLLCEAQALTPRRLSLRIMPEWTVCGYRCGTRRLCVGADDDPFLRLRRQERELCLTVSMAERECSVTGEAAVPPGHPAPEDLLLWRLYPQVGSCQLVGNKLLVKGDVTLSALYRCQQQKLHTYTAVLPFSQIVESPSGGEEGEVTVCPQLLCGEARLLRGEESSGFAVSAELRLLVRITRRETVACVTDLYSIRCAVQPDTEPVSLPPAQERPTRQEAAAHLDFGRQRPFVYVTDVSCAPAAAEDGTPCAAVRTPIACRVKLGSRISMCTVSTVGCPWSGAPVTKYGMPMYLATMAFWNVPTLLTTWPSQQIASAAGGSTSTPSRCMTKAGILSEMTVTSKPMSRQTVAVRRAP